MATQDTIHIDDIEALAQILEVEQVSHRRAQLICFGLFIFWFLVLIVAIAVGVAHITGILTVSAASGAGETLVMLQILAPLSGTVVAFFSMWWTAHTCVNSIERTLYAARAGRHKLFITFIEQVQCSGKKQRQIWVEAAKSAIG